MSARERQLAIVFAVALIAFAGLVVGTTGLRWTKDLIAENRRLAERVGQLDGLIASRDVWQTRETWLNESAPYFASRQEASAALLEALDDLTTAGVVVTSRELSEPAGDDNGEVENAYFEETAVRLELEASEPALYAWIHQLHRPDTFRGITALRLERAEAGRLRAELELTQFYQP